MTKAPILTNLGKPVYMLTALGTSLLLFDFNYYLMANLPGEQNNMCVLGAGLTPANLLFTAFLSISMGILVAGIFATISQRAVSQKVAVTTLSGIGMITGTLTVFCTLCTLPVISLFGVSIWLSFFTDYNILLKILSVVVMGMALYLLNRQLKMSCERCVSS